MSSRTIYLNQDDAAFTRCHPLSDMAEEGVNAVVDYYAQGEQLAGLAFCVNMQRALFDSREWETIVRPGEPDGTKRQRSGEEIATAALFARGVDHIKLWLERARSHGIEAFLTMRMNDCHGLESHGGFCVKKGDDQDHYSRHASSFWKANPQLRRAPYRYERSFEGAFNYAEPEVRMHHLRLISELFERYDMDGLELDWMRWMFMFAPGGEERGREILTGFVGEVDRLRKAAEKRLGHPIQLRHRLPAEPQTCLALGYDAGAWAERGFVDQIVLSCFGAVANFDYPIELWRRFVGPRVRLIALIEPHAGGYPGTSAESYHFLYGAASAALRRGADGVYLFNECYREAFGPEQRKLLLDILNTAGDLETLNRVVRRHPLTYPQVHAPGEAPRVSLPIPSKNPAYGADSGRWANNITLRLHVGGKPRKARYVLRLGFSEETPVDLLEPMTVRINTKPVSRAEAPCYEDRTLQAFAGREIALLPKSARHLLHYEIPGEGLDEGVNVAEFEPPVETGRLEWAEIVVLPEA